jgi:uncharacterized SAM-binding protein YcdF (DUF218 family)
LIPGSVSTRSLPDNERSTVFLFKKAAATLVSPVPLCVDLLLAGIILLWFTRRQKAGRILVSAGVAGLSLFGSPFVSDWLVRPLEIRYRPLAVTSGTRGNPGDPALRVKYIVVLAGGYVPNPRRPATAQLGDTLSRVVEGVRLSRRLPGCRLVMSGGGPPGRVPESELMAEAAVSLGVNQQDILLESRSRDTGSEARLVGAMIGKQALILVTEASHMPRAMALFRKQGMNPIAAPASYLAPESREFFTADLLPSNAALDASQRAVYEYLALGWEWVRGEI